jgi:hypothetical protein
MNNAKKIPFLFGRRFLLFDLAKSGRCLTLKCDVMCKGYHFSHAISCKGARIHERSNVPDALLQGIVGSFLRSAQDLSRIFAHKEFLGACMRNLIVE